MKLARLQPLVALAPTLTRTIASNWTDERRGSRHERGYGTAWEKRRIAILKRDKYLCQCSECRARARIRPASEVDHITSKAEWRITHGSLAGVDDDTNLQAINHDCHKLKTQRDREAAFAAFKTPGGVSRL